VEEKSQFRFKRQARTEHERHARAGHGPGQSPEWLGGSVPTEGQEPRQRWGRLVALGRAYEQTSGGLLADRALLTVQPDGDLAGGRLSLAHL
jgi:hypothetical protein